MAGNALDPHSIGFGNTTENTLRVVLANDTPMGSSDRTQYADQVVHVAGDIGTEALAVRQDAPTDMASGNARFTPLQVDDLGALRVVGRFLVGDAAPANPYGQVFLYRRTDTLGTLSEDDGDWALPRCNSKGAQYVQQADLNSQDDKIAVADDNGVSCMDNTNHALQVSSGKTLKTVTGTISDTTTIVDAVLAKRIKVTSYSIMTTSSNAVVATFNDDVSGTAAWTLPMQAIPGSLFGSNLSTPAPSFLFATSAGNPLELQLSASESVTYNVTYFDDDAA